MERGLDKDSSCADDGHWNHNGHRAASDVIEPMVGDLLQPLPDPSTQGK
jgi:hypothetical protein